MSFCLLIIQFVLQAGLDEFCSDLLRLLNFLETEIYYPLFLWHYPSRQRNTLTFIQPLTSLFQPSPSLSVPLMGLAPGLEPRAVAT